MKAPPTARVEALTPAIRSASDDHRERRQEAEDEARRPRRRRVEPAVEARLHSAQSQWIAAVPTMTSTITVPTRNHSP